MYDYVVWASAAWMFLMVFMMSTSNFRSLLLFRIVPFVLACALLVLWAADNGYVINTGA